MQTQTNTAQHGSNSVCSCMRWRHEQHKACRSHSPTPVILVRRVCLWLGIADTKWNNEKVSELESLTQPWISKTTKTVKKKKIEKPLIVWIGVLAWLKWCFTSTETVGLLGTEARDVHLDFHTAPELWVLASVRLCCIMSSDVGWHIRDKLRPMREHGSINLYVHGSQKAR